MEGDHALSVARIYDKECGPFRWKDQSKSLHPSARLPHGNSAKTLNISEGTHQVDCTMVVEIS